MIQFRFKIITRDGRIFSRVTIKMPIIDGNLNETYKGCRSRKCIQTEPLVVMRIRWQSAVHRNGVLRCRYILYARLHARTAFMLTGNLKSAYDETYRDLIN